RAHVVGVVVDGAVAVVVDAVARLRLGADHLRAGEPARPGPGHAVARVRRGARAGGVDAAGVAGEPQPRDVVGLAVAVVVLAVARLRLLRQAADARARPHQALVEAERADVAAAGVHAVAVVPRRAAALAGPGLAEVVVDLAVAVVVLR